jgi:hypothetical protein
MPKRTGLAALVATAVLATVSCSGTPAAAPPSTPGGTTSTTVAPTTTASAVTDAEVCGSLERTGKPFYPTYAQLMKNEKLTIKPIVLSAQLATLSTTGVPEGSSEIDGTSVINNASPVTRESLTRMVRDADRLAQRYADAATGATVGSDITEIVNSFTDALVTCTKAGYQPTWFDPEVLLK